MGAKEDLFARAIQIGSELEKNSQQFIRLGEQALQFARDMHRQGLKSDRELMQTEQLLASAAAAAKRACAAATKALWGLELDGPNPTKANWRPLAKSMSK